jgi:hypothetical protein
MSRPKHYAVEVHSGKAWETIIADESRDFCLGYLAAHRLHPGPSLAARVVRSDGHVLDTAPADERASLGMVAGFPSAEQYERAADLALAAAAEIHKRVRRAEARRASKRGAP